jgi:NADP-dependent 3-hydroxy acid dehydrogenase YdfG
MLNSPVILVTGASSGIGEVTARFFGDRGYRVVLAARRFDRLEALSRTIQDAGGQALPVAADVSNLEDIQNLVGAALEEFGQIDVLFNNAGFGRLAWLEDLDPVKDIEAQLQVNLNGVIQTTRAVLPYMIERRSGHIINMASMAGLIATPTYSIYAAGKFAVRGFSEALRREVGVLGIHVSVIYPGGVRTEFGEHTGAKFKTRTTTPASLKLAPEDVARAVFGVVRRPRRTVVLPWVMVLVAWANTLSPGFIDWFIERRFTRPERGL